jgi:hypothetical protein
MSSATARFLREHYFEFADDLIGSLIDCLVLGRELFEGDIDLMLVGLGVATRSTGLRDMREVRLDDVLTGRVQSFPSGTTNVGSLAASLGLPRETTRRKVNRLLELGLIERRGDGLALTPAASVRFTPVRERLLDAFAHLKDRVETIERRPAADSSQS